VIISNFLSTIIKKLINYLYKNKFLFFIIAIPIKLFDILFIKTNNEILFYGYKGRYSGNAASLFRYCVSEKYKFRPIWLLDKKDLFYFENKLNYFQLPKKNSNIFAHIKLLFKIAKAKVIVITSVGDLSIYCSLLYKKKRIEVLLPHGTTIKTGGVMAKHLNKKQKKIWSTISKRFDLISVSSRIEKYLISSSLNLDPDKVKILGVQRGEFLKNNLQNNNNSVNQLEKIFSKLKIEKKNFDIKNSTIVLYAPTHRDHLQGDYEFTLLEKIDGFNLEQLNEFLKKENMILFLREHAESKLKPPNGNLNLKSNIINFSIENFPDLEKYLNFIDVIITDYSGIFIEHLLTKKSLVFALFDLDEYESDRGLILPKEVLFPGYIFRSQDKFIYYLKNRETIDKSYIDQRKQLHSLFFEKSYEGACKRTMEEIYKLT